MIRSRAALSALGLLGALGLAGGCRPADVRDSTAVGNPTLTTARMAETVDVDVFDATLEGATLVAVGCDGSDTVLAENVGLDLLSGSVVRWPAGRWCGVELFSDEPLVLEGEVDGDDDFALRLELDLEGVFAFGTAGFDVDGQDLFVELGEPGWLDGGELEDEDEDGFVEIEPGDDVHDDLVASLQETSRVFEDADGDGEAGEGEILASSGDEDDEEDDEDDEAEEDDPEATGGTGCQVGPSPVGALPLALLLPLLRTRRREGA